MPADISLITLGVADVAKATSFYEQLGFVRSKTTFEPGERQLLPGGTARARAVGP